MIHIFCFVFQVSMFFPSNSFSGFSFVFDRFERFLWIYKCFHTKNITSNNFAHANQQQAIRFNRFDTNESKTIRLRRSIRRSESQYLCETFIHSFAGSTNTYECVFVCTQITLSNTINHDRVDFLFSYI